MRLLLLGTTGYHPNDQRHTMCLMLPEVGVVFDAGTAMYRVGEQLQTPTLDIYLTHAHLDHVVGLTFMYDVLEGRQLERVTVHGAARKIAALKSHLFAEDLFPAAPPFQWQSLSETEILADGGKLTHCPLQHPGGSVGYRIDWPNRSLAYITDTVADVEAPYVDFIRGVDLLIHECFFPDGWEERAVITGHSCTTPVAQVAAQAQVQRLVLVHMNPLATQGDPIGLHTARSIFPATELGQDRMELVF